MSIPQDPETEELLGRANRGDQSAVEQLLGRHRERLRQMVTLRMDGRLAARIDASDVVQEALTVASQKLPEYLRKPSLSFYPWLRQIAWERLVDFHRRHILAGKRSVSREEPQRISDTSAMQLADRLLSSGTDPLKRLLRDELLARVRAALGRLATRDREILMLRHLEQLSSSECAAVLAISKTAAKQRHLRALRRLRHLLNDELPEEP